MARRCVIEPLLILALVGLPTTARAGRTEAGSEQKRISEQARLERIQAEIAELKQRLAGSAARAGSVLDAIEELDLTAALLGREAESLRQEARTVRAHESETQESAAALETRITDSERDLGRLLREVYKVGPTRYLRVIAASSSPAEFAAGQRAVEALGLGESRRIEAYRADRQRLDDVLAELGRQRDDLDRIESELQAKDQELRDSRRRKNAVLAGIRREQASQTRALAELVGMEKEIRALLETLAKPGPGGALSSLGFGRRRGQLAWPIQGTLAVPFGNVRHPRFNTVVPHPGIDIAAPAGQGVHTVFDGRVIFSNWFRGYGEMVVIDHGDGYLSIYGHVSERLVVVGQDVRQGELIARSGEGGAFETPGLYFEIRHDGRPEDPGPWLRGSTGRAAERPGPTPRGSHHTP
jgi:septal ring factor EnvC (AmiA/AmiB activator)